MHEILFTVVLSISTVTQVSQCWTGTAKCIHSPTQKGIRKRWEQD